MGLFYIFAICERYLMIYMDGKSAMGTGIKGGASDAILRELMYSSPEAVDPEEHIIATYFVEGSKPLEKIAEEIAIECSTGTWTPVGYETLEVRERYGAKILRIMGTGGSGFIEIAYNASNYDPEIGGIANLLSDIAGNLFDMNIVDKVKLMDIWLPSHWARAHPGPKFGIEGVRELAGAEDGRPLIGAIMKPNLGLDTRTYAKLAYETALGGLDFIKDDEALVNPKYCPLFDRLSAVMEALDKARQETGKKVLYALNITHRADEILELADRAIEGGANHLMVCMTYEGYGAIQALAEDPSINVPIHVHRCGHGAFTRDPKHGIESALMSKLARICGADELHVGSRTGKFIFDALDARKCIAAMKAPWEGFKRTLPVIAAGISPANLGANFEVAGRDALFLAGGGIHGHPDGSTAGAKAMMQAARALIEGRPLEEAAKSHRELARALEWGGRPSA
ncbi:MAG: RuBisCO large subunit C-terminal-like domain-containing protein [Candidatus Bathyarchaeia archaeon]